MSKATGAGVKPAPVLTGELNMLTERLIQELNFIGTHLNAKVTITKLQWLMEELDKASMGDITTLIRKNRDCLKGLNTVINESYADNNFRCISNEYLGTLMRMLPFASGCTKGIQ